MKNIFYLLVITLLFNSCDIVVDLDIPEHKPVLVVNSVLSADSIMTAYISHSKGAFDSNSISSLNDATVKVFEDGLLLGEMNKLAIPSSDHSGSVDNVYKYYLNRMPIVGKYYSYEIEHSDYENLRAETQIPNGVDLTVEDVSLSQGEYGGKYYRLRCSFEDASGENYYRLRVHSSLFNDFDDDIRDNFLDLETTDPSIMSSAGAASDGESYWGNDALFDDRLFTNSKKEITLDFLGSYYSEGEGSKENYIVELSTISKAYFNYLTSFRAQEYIADEFSFFASEPIQVYTNIENGLGILGAMAKDTVLLDITE